MGDKLPSHRAFVVNHAAGFPFQGLPVGLGTYALYNLITYAYNCYYGGLLTEKSSTVSDEAMWSNWQVYPLSMQKKLLLIIMVSKDRPSSINYRNIYFVNPEAFYQIMNLSYSLVTFMYGVLTD